MDTAWVASHVERVFDTNLSIQSLNQPKRCARKTDARPFWPTLYVGKDLSPGTAGLVMAPTWTKRHFDCDEKRKKNRIVLFEKYEKQNKHMHVHVQRTKYLLVAFRIFYERCVDKTAYRTCTKNTR